MIIDIVPDTLGGRHGYSDRTIVGPIAVRSMPNGLGTIFLAAIRHLNDAQVSFLNIPDYGENVSERVGNATIQLSTGKDLLSRAGEDAVEAWIAAISLYEWWISPHFAPNPLSVMGSPKCTHCDARYMRSPDGRCTNPECEAVGKWKLIDGAA